MADVEGRVLWREGLAGVLRHADHLGFIGGSAWTEGNVGTNAIGTCLVTEAPVHIHAAEHYAESHTPWTCAAAPLRDPSTGRVLGVVDLSGPAHTVHAGTLSMVTLAARLAELEIRSATQDRLQMLRAIAAPLLARVSGPALAVTYDGITAAATGLVPPGRILLPTASRAARPGSPVTDWSQPSRCQAGGCYASARRRLRRASPRSWSTCRLAPPA
ncbi:GAF domain-containing protein [Aeromicrobium sp. UC242_57]